MEYTESAENNVARAFDRQAPVFDQLFANNRIVEYKRSIVRSHVELLIRPGSRILELNAGTGEDAIYFAGKGFRVHTTDLSPGMNEVRREKILRMGLVDRVSSESCSFTRLQELSEKGPYDMVFSNFAGLNCTPDLGSVLGSLGPLLKPGGLVTLVIMPRYCLWELAQLFTGNWKTAFRRFGGHKGTAARVEGESFRCWYYGPSYVQKRLGRGFALVRLQALCSLVPPSWFEGFTGKYPRAFKFLQKAEHRLGNAWPWNRAGDYYIISLRKRFS